MESIIHEVGDQNQEGVILNNIGGVYKDQNQYAQALNQYNKALMIFREIGALPVEGITLKNIGEVYQEQGQYSQALYYYKQALLIFQQTGLKNLAHWESPWYPPDMGVRKWASKDRINE